MRNPIVKAILKRAEEGDERYNTPEIMPLISLVSQYELEAIYRQEEINTQADTIAKLETELFKLQEEIEGSTPEAIADHLNKLSGLIREMG